VVTKEEGESAEVFAERVRGTMAKSLGLIASPFSRHDRNELVKRMGHKTELSRSQPVRDDGMFTVVHFF